MHRENLIAAVETAARECELSFQTGYEHQMNEMLRKTPALWLDTLAAVKSEGLNEGIKTYAVKMTIVEMPDRQNAGQHEQLWRQMEDKAAAICRRLGRAECVKSIAATEMLAANNTLTNRGEVSLSVKMNIEVPFTKI